MTTFQSMFDVGACAVEVYSHVTASVWKGTLGKGDSKSGLSTDNYSAGDADHCTFTLSVTADGVVSVTPDAGMEFGANSNPPEIIVTPTYDMTGRGVRVSGANVVIDGANEVSGCNVWFGDNQTEPMVLSPDSSKPGFFSPDPGVYAGDDGAYVDFEPTVVWPS